MAGVWTGTCKRHIIETKSKPAKCLSVFSYDELTTDMLLKPAVLKGSLATGFGVGAGPGVPGDPETSRSINKDV